MGKLFSMFIRTNTITRLDRNKLLWLILLLPGFFFKTEAQTNDSIRAQSYNNLAISSFNKFQLETAESYCDSALRVHENAKSYLVLAYIDHFREHWTDAIRHAERSMELDSSYLPLYIVLFDSYYNAKKWDDALKVAEKAKRVDPTGATSQNIKIALASQQSKNISSIILFICFSILSIIFIAPLFQKSKKKFAYFTSGTYPRLPFLILVAAAVSCFLYITFFALSQWIWSLNPSIAPSEFTPSLRSFIPEHDGVESFSLYVVMFIDILISVSLTNWLISLQFDKSRLLLLSIALITISGYYFFRIGFLPPLPDIHESNETGFPTVVIIIGLLSIALFFLYKRMKLLVNIIILLLIAFASIFGAYPSSKVDLMYVLAPALRLSHGFKISEIYFQYDLLLSFLGLCWMKMHLLLDWFPYLGQASFFLFFIGAFMFAQSFFKNKSLSVPFIIALIIIRYYSVWEAGASIIQSSPLRLDLWLIWLWLAYKKGIYHWATGLSLALLLIFHRNLGLLYLASYIVLILFLLAMDLYPLIKEKRIGIDHLAPVFQKHFRLNVLNLLLMGISVIACFFLFGDFFSRSGVEYRKYGVGMLPIDRNSFYWYVPVLLSSFSILLYFYKNKLTIKYLTSGMLIILLSIANSMYFFGRSHENNILNISGILVLALFVFFDLVIFSISLEPVKSPRLKSKKTSVRKRTSLKTTLAMSLPLLFIAMSSYYYAHRISEKMSNQVDNLGEFRFAYPLNISIDTRAIREITSNSSKVYFLDFQADFYYYYYGQYTPQGYYSPCATWIFKKDLRNFLQTLLNDHYYIVLNATKFVSFDDYLPYLDYNSSVEKHNLVAISKEPVPHLLPDGSDELYHIGIKDSSSNNGIQHAAVVLNKNFTIEALIRPIGSQLPKATILDNSEYINGFSGITLQENTSIPNQYVFGFGYGSGSQNITFTLESNRWHYLAIAVSDDNAKIYDWGKQIADGAVTTTILNSNEPLIIGNSKTRDARFNGITREIKISSGVSESNIMQNAAHLSKQINAATD